MLVIGAKGHAKEILSILEEKELSDLAFFDDISSDIKPKLFDKYTVIRSFEDACIYLASSDRKFVLGIGKPHLREMIYNKFSNAKFEAISVISSHSVIGSYDVRLGAGLNVMQYVFISNSVEIGDGTLINSHASLHHDCKIDDFVEIGPSATLLGGVEVGRLSFIGASATILPNVKIGNNAIIGAGAVVTNNVPSNTKAVGVPAKIQ